MSPGRRDEFLSEEDLDLRNLSFDEVMAWYGVRRRQAQASNDLDAHLYSHGVFVVDPSVPGPTPPTDRFLRSRAALTKRLRRPGGRDQDSRAESR